MTVTSDQTTRPTDNLRDLAARFDDLRSLLEQALGRAGPSRRPPTSPSEPAALTILAERLGLSQADRDLLTLCAGAEMDSGIAGLCAELNGDPRRLAPTVAIALSALPGMHWGLLAPDAPLRRWALIELGAAELLAHAPLRIDERILHYLAGITTTDPRLVDIIDRLGRDGALGSLTDVPDGQYLSRLLTARPSPVIALHGGEAAGLRAVAVAAAAAAGLSLAVAQAAALPTEPHERAALARRWQREALLSHAVLLIETDGQASELSTIGAFVSAFTEPVIVAGDQPVRPPTARPVVRVAATAPTITVRQRLWQAALAEAGLADDELTDTLAANFQLSPPLISAAASDALARLDSDAAPEAVRRCLWDACRRQARPRLDDLATRIESPADWDDLVLPEPQLSTLRELVAQAAQQRRVYDHWGFGRPGRGLGTTVIFAGVSGTGKTLAAEVIANTLGLDAYRIDLSGVVSKYIGETEKNLRRIFAAAEQGGAVLIFDEADALFGKRGEVRDSHDRYANIEVSYLLQQMESYRGLAILTTNMLSNFDRAFMRRVRFIVQFPFPTAEQRREIWRRIFPSAAPIANLDLHKLARLNVSGGSIRTIALNAAFLAADAGRPIAMSHLRRAAANEFTKLEQPLPELEVRDWIDDHA